MKYDYDYFHKELLRMKSLDYDVYKDYTELDVLKLLLLNEMIGEYEEVDWAWMFHYVVDTKQARKISDVIVELFHKDTFLLVREEKIRVLTYLRDHCKEILPNEKKEEIDAIEKSCAEIISFNIKQSARDQVHGKFAELPRPNLKQIAMGEPKPRELKPDEQIIIDAIPIFPNDRNVIKKHLILDEAIEQVRLFRLKVDAYELSKEATDKPCMRQKEYIQPIVNGLTARANRYLYFDNNPAYQVLFVMCILMRLPNTKHSWWETRFAEAIPDYLEMTNNFKGSKKKIDTAIIEIRSLTELALDFDIVDPPIPKPQEPGKITRKKNQKFKYIVSDDLNEIRKIENEIRIHIESPAKIISYLNTHKSEISVPHEKPTEVCRELNKYFKPPKELKENTFRDTWRRIYK